jgi:hypothetical protein
MLYTTCDVHFTKAKLIDKRQPILSSERIFHKDYNHRGLDERKNTGGEPQVSWPQDEMIGGKLPVVK